MKKFIAILLTMIMLCAAFTSCGLPESSAETFTSEAVSEETDMIPTETETENISEETEPRLEAESTVMRMINSLGFTNVDEEILKSYVPTYSCTVNVEKGGLSSFTLVTFFCGEYINYYVMLNRDGEIMKITSTEKDYNSRFVYYPRTSGEEG